MSVFFVAVNIMVNSIWKYQTLSSCALRKTLSLFFRESEIKVHIFFNTFHLIWVCSFEKKRVRAGERGKPEGVYNEVND